MSLINCLLFKTQGFKDLIVDFQLLLLLLPITPVLFKETIKRTLITM